MLVGFVFIASEGETGPAGLDRDEQGRLVVFIALCEGETVERIEVTTSVEDSLLWTVEGEGSAQERWVVGEPLPPGYQVVAKSPDLSGTQGYVYADVKTSELYAWNSASQEALALPGVTFDDAQVPAEQFHAKARSSYPCHDPYNDRLSAIGGAIGYGLAVVFLGLSLVMFLWRRRPKPEAV